tara:strand:+ start:17 stop:193 length:177 start_codon:yes stop_codon:yes gene_type:complete
VKLPNPKKIQIGDWVRIRKVGIDGVYQVIEINEDQVIVEQSDGGYKHKMKVRIEEVMK